MPGEQVNVALGHPPLPAYSGQATVCLSRARQPLPRKPLCIRRGYTTDKSLSDCSSPFVIPPFRWLGGEWRSERRAAGSDTLG